MVSMTFRVEDDGTATLFTCVDGSDLMVELSVSGDDELPTGGNGGVPVLVTVSSTVSGDPVVSRVVSLMRADNSVVFSTDEKDVDLTCAGGVVQLRIVAGDTLVWCEFGDNEVREFADACYAMVDATRRLFVS